MYRCSLSNQSSCVSESVVPPVLASENEYTCISADEPDLPTITVSDLPAFHVAPLYNNYRLGIAYIVTFIYGNMITEFIRFHYIYLLKMYDCRVYLISLQITVVISV